MRMTTVFSTAALAGAIALGAAAFTPAAAKPGWKGGHHHGVSAGHGVKAGWHGRHTPPGWSRGNKRGWYKGHAYRGRVPPGWR